MKCNNCGYANAPNRISCEHCNAPLKGSVIASLADRKALSDSPKCSNCGTLNEQGALKCSSCNAPLKGSILADNAAKTVAKPLDRPTAPKMQDMLYCTSCGYPNIKTASQCIRCAFPLAPAPANAPVQKAEEAPKNRKLAPLPNGTINPWSTPLAPVNKFSLRPLPRSGEKAPAKLPFEGDQHDLSRKDLEPANRTITSKIQAAIEHKDGAWQITDLSPQKSTFLLVRGTMKLQKGDIILMGDRMFEFDC